MKATLKPNMIHGLGRLAVGFVLLGLFFSIGLVLLDRLVMPLVVGRGREVQVPHVIRLPLQEARTILEKNHLLLDTVTEEHDPVVPEGLILSQEPEAGTTVKRGRRVRLRVSKGGEWVIVPDLHGISLRQAEILLQRRHLRMGTVTWANSEELPAQVVVATTPAPNCQLPWDTPVDLVVSMGSLTDVVVVPSFIGLNLDEAMKLAERSGLKIGGVHRKKDENLLPETVLEQSPLFGQEVPHGASVELVISQLE